MSNIYSSVNDAVGLTTALVLFYRVFVNDFPWSRPGTYQVVIVAPGVPDFRFPQMFGVMDDFGDLVNVGGL